MGLSELFSRKNKKQKQLPAAAENKVDESDETEQKQLSYPKNELKAAKYIILGKWTTFNTGTKNELA